jgi:hypothetical protein
MVALSASEPITTAVIGAEMSPEVEIARLIPRLEHGYDVIESARAAGDVVDVWEDKWLRMLRRYEELVDLVVV